MPHRLDARTPAFEAAFEAFLAIKRGAEADVARVVDGILADLRARGDAALIENTERFDRIRLTPETLRISEDEIAEAAARCDPTDLMCVMRAHRSPIKDARTLSRWHESESCDYAFTLLD